MEFTPDDFSRMRFPAHKIENDMPFDLVFRELSIFPEFNEKESLQVCNALSVDKRGLTQVTRYIVFLYDMNSPLMNIEKINVRKATAAFEAGYKLDSNGKFDKAVLNLLFNKYLSVNKMIVRFLVFQANSDFAAMCAFDEKLQQMLLKLIDSSGTYDQEKDKDMVSVTKDLLTNISELKQRVLVGYTDVNLEKALYDEIENEQLQLKPEDMAKKMKQFLELPQDLIWSYYNKPEKLIDKINNL